MKVNEAVARAGAVYPELLTDERRFAWLSEIEERITTELAREACVQITSNDGERELCAPNFLSEVYPLYLVMKTDLSNSDHARYICHSEAFSSGYKELANYFTRTNAPVDTNKIVF